MYDGGAPEWREIIERTHARLTEELTAAIAAERQRAIDAAVEGERESAAIELERARAEAKAELERAREQAKAELGRTRDEADTALERARRERDEAAARSGSAARQATAEALNQALRRIRRANAPDSALALLAEISGAYSHKSAVLVFEKSQARVAASRGLAASLPGSNGSSPALDLLLEKAPALTSAIESREPVTVLAKDAEVSSALVRLFAAAPPEKLYLFPVIARHDVVAMLVAAGEVFPPAVELLAEAVGMRLDSMTTAAGGAPAENPVRIRPAGTPVAGLPEHRGWDDLSPEDQMLHLQAQRVARVRVAKMRLEREEAWRRGLAQSDVYGALRRDIESARTEFLQTFLSKSSTMVDYLHLEILRSLANDDDRVLGREYPGPMV